MSDAFDLHRDRGFEFIQTGRLEEALTELWAARDLNPQDVWTQRSLGTVLSKMGQKEASITQFREAIRLQPDDEDAHQSFVYGLQKAARPDEALAAVRQALIACPNSSTLYSYLGYCLGVEADKTKDKLGWEQSAAAFQRAIDIDPTNVHALHAQGVLYWRLRQKRKAVVALKAAVISDPNNAAAHIQLWEYQGRMWDILGMGRTINTMNKLPASEDMDQHYANMSREWPRLRGILLIGAGVIAVLIGALIWNRRRKD